MSSLKVCNFALGLPYCLNVMAGLNFSLHSLVWNYYTYEIHIVGLLNFRN